MIYMFRAVRKTIACCVDHRKFPYTGTGTGEYWLHFNYVDLNINAVT